MMQVKEACHMFKFPLVFVMELQVGVACGFCFTGTDKKKKIYIYIFNNKSTWHPDLWVLDWFAPRTLEVCSSIAVTDRDFFQQAGQAASGCISWGVREVGIWWSWWWWNMFGNQMCVFLWCGKMINLEKVLNLLHAPFAHIGCEDLWSTSPTMRLRLFVKNSRQRFLKQHLQWKLPNQNGNCLTFDRKYYTILYIFEILNFWVSMS